MSKHDHATIQERWCAAIHDRWKTFSRQWTRLQRRSSPAAVHEMRSASRRLVSSINVAALSAGVRAAQASRRLERISDRLGPLRDNYIYRKTMDHLKASSNAQAFTRFLARENSDGRRRVEKFFGQHRKRAVRRRIDKIERRLRRVSRDWTPDDFHTAFEKVLRRRYESLIDAHKAWEDRPDNKRFHLMRIELRELRYASEAVADVLGLSRTHKVQASIKALKSLQTTMGDVHDIHKLRTKLVAWIGSRPAQKRDSEMSVASELQKELDNRMVEFKDHSMASEALLPFLPALRRLIVRGASAATPSH